MQDQFAHLTICNPMFPSIPFDKSLSSQSVSTKTMPLAKSKLGMVSSKRPTIVRRAKSVPTVLNSSNLRPEPRRKRAAARLKRVVSTASSTRERLVVDRRYPERRLLRQPSKKMVQNRYKLPKVPEHAVRTNGIYCNHQLRMKLDVEREGLEGLQYLD